MTDRNGKVIPEPSLRRLPRYYHFLLELLEQEVSVVSCSTIGKYLNLDPTQVRKDLEITDIVGKPKVGYSTVELARAIEDFLGWNNVNEAFLVGAGNLGTALLGYEKFKQFGLSIIAAFDVDKRKVGKHIHGKPVLPLEKLPNLARRMSIHIGVITAPALVAQSVADLMIEGGIKAIWNFAPVTLQVPEDIIVHNEDLYSSLASLSFKVAQTLKTPVKKEEFKDANKRNSSLRSSKVRKS
jgi:redox-sensing transcriptional repressor